MAMRVGRLASMGLHGHSKAWIPADFQEKPLPTTGELLLGCGDTDGWMPLALQPFAQDFSWLGGSNFWMASTDNASAALDSLCLCGLEVQRLCPADTSVLWHCEAPPPALEPPPGLAQETPVAWPPGKLVRTELQEDVGFCVVLLGPTEFDMKTIHDIVRYAGAGRHLIGSIAVGEEHRAVALVGETTGWLLTARAPTAGVAARMME
jgi:hypothetical protein